MSYLSNSNLSSASTHFDSEIKEYKSRSRTIDGIETITKRLVYSKIISDKDIIQPFKYEYKQPIQKEKEETNFFQIGLALCILTGLFMLTYNYSKTKYDLTQYKAINQSNVERIFDLDNLTYIKNYHEVSMAKYYYYDLIAEHCYNKIIQKLRILIWMEEDIIKQYIQNEFDEQESEILIYKIWRLRRKREEIDVQENINNKLIWVYKKCIYACY